MTNPLPIEQWHELVATRNKAGIAALLADDVCFYSPVVHTPQQGKTITTLYLQAAFDVLLTDSFRYVREIVDNNQAMLEFTLEMDNISVNGVDIITWNSNKLITEFKVMVRPLKAIQKVHQQMAAMLKAAS